jgi:hypothetical protein
MHVNSKTWDIGVARLCITLLKLKKTFNIALKIQMKHQMVWKEKMMYYKINILAFG